MSPLSRVIRSNHGLALHQPYARDKVQSILSSLNVASHRPIPDNVKLKIGKNLHRVKYHPLHIIKSKIETFCSMYAKQQRYCSEFKIYDDLNPIVDIKSCFDDLCLPKNHVSRQSSDTYYLNDQLLLRTHTSAHQNHFISSGDDAFLCSGDVYRRDDIDSSHYPVFHQMEGVRIFKELDYQNTNERINRMSIELAPYYDERFDIPTNLIIHDLKDLLTNLIRHLFGQNIEMRWRSDYFPFTDPSYELEVLFNGEWLEVLGCGVIHEDVMRYAGRDLEKGWAFGLGLERLAMILFGIPDIRLFWTDDERFHKQFIHDVLYDEEYESSSNFCKHKFIPYSKHPLCWKDVSFWCPEEEFHQNDVFEVVRAVTGDLVEKVEVCDQYIHPKTHRKSLSYRISYRHMSRSLTNEEVDILQKRVRIKLVGSLGVELR
jgi:phenylalanyl-tRNA synthetase alpha chain